MEYIGITKPELTAICAKWAPVIKTSVGKLLMQLELFAVDFHDKEIEDVKRRYPDWTPEEDDVPIMDHAVAWIGLNNEIKKARRRSNVLQ